MESTFVEEIALCLAQPCSKFVADMTAGNLEQHIQELMMGYEMLRSGTSTLSSLSSDMKDRQQSEDISKKLALAPSKNPNPAACLNPSCKSLDIHVDANGACAVCFQCGLIRDTAVFEDASISAVFHTGVSRIVVHRYSRIAVVRGVLRSLKGETNLCWTLAEEDKIYNYCQSEGSPQSAALVKKCIKTLKLPRRLLHHATTIAFRLWPIPIPNPSEYEIRSVLLRFRELENVWDRLALGSSVRNGRKKFLSLPLVWKFLCQAQGFVELGEIMDAGQIKNRKNREKQTETLKHLICLADK